MRPRLFHSALPTADRSLINTQLVTQLALRYPEPPAQLSYRLPIQFRTPTLELFIFIIVFMPLFWFYVYPDNRHPEATGWDREILAIELQAISGWCREKKRKKCAIQDKKSQRAMLVRGFSFQDVNGGAILGHGSGVVVVSRAA